MKQFLIFSILLIITSCTDSRIGGLKPVEKKDSAGIIVEEGMEDSKGQKHGVWLNYSNKNLPTVLTTYANGQKNGIMLKFNESGSITEKAVYKDDKLEGSFKKFLHSRIKEESFYENGLLKGERILYYDNGKMQEEGKWVNGKREGEVKWYDEQGNLKLHYEYKNGEKIKEIAVPPPPTPSAPEPK